jgi:AraC-like DNA-binding protein
MIIEPPAYLRTRQTPPAVPGNAHARPYAVADCPAWFASASQGRQRVGALAALPSVLRACGVDPLQTLSRCGLRPDALDDPEGLMSFPAMMQLLEAAAHEAACAHIGLKLAASATLAQLGVLGEALRAGPTVGDALQTFVRHQRLHGEGLAAFTLDHGGDCVEFGIVALWAGSERRVALYDTAAAVAAAWVRELSGGAVRPGQVCLPRARTGDAAIYREHFGCRVVFESNHAALFLEKSALARDVLPAEYGRRPELGRPMPRSDDLATALYRSIRLLLTTDRTPHSAAVAQQCRAHERTLRRRLAEQGVCYRTVLGQVRYDLARQLLAETRREMGDIAQACAYGDATAFQRAFRRWAGMAPGEWRAQRSAGHGAAPVAPGHTGRLWQPGASAPTRSVGDYA